MVRAHYWFRNLSISDSSFKDTFGSITDWIFDLDNTLYPHDCDLFSQIDVKITEYVSSYFSLDFQSARSLQKDLYCRHGTTLRGLTVEHNVDATDFLSKVHDIDYSAVSPNPCLYNSLVALPGRKHIFTNADKGHVSQVLSRLQIPSDIFSTIFDIIDASMIPKPDSPAYESFLQVSGASPTTSVFFEDMPRNLEVPQSLGMRTVLVLPGDPSRFPRESWEESDEFTPSFTTCDLPNFLKNLVEVL